MSDNITGRWRRIYSNEWHAAEFQGLTDGERVVYFYLRTGPQSTSIGIFRVSTAVGVEDIGNLTAIEFDQRLSGVCEALSWRFDVPTRVLWIPAWIADNPPQSPNVCKSWQKLLANVPDCDIKFEAARAILAALKDLPQAFREAFGNLPKDSRISKSKPQSQPEANQGAGELGRSGKEKQRAGALRAGAGESGGSFTPPSYLISAARDAIRLNNRLAPKDVLIESTMLALGRSNDVSRSLVSSAVDAALAELAQ
jgi:hypothetical protein